jgi:hypothetical protein
MFIILELFLELDLGFGYVLRSGILVLRVIILNAMLIFRCLIDILHSYLFATREYFSEFFEIFMVNHYSNLIRFNVEINSYF